MIFEFLAISVTQFWAMAAYGYLFFKDSDKLDTQRFREWAVGWLMILGASAITVIIIDSFAKRTSQHSADDYGIDGMIAPISVNKELDSIHPSPSCTKQ